MQTSRLFLAMIAAAGLPALAAQITPADQEKMLQVLRQKVAEERAKTSPAPEPSHAPKPAISAPSAGLPTRSPLLPSDFDNLLAVLRQKVDEERAKMTPPSEPVMPKPVADEKPAVAAPVAQIQVTQPPPAETPAEPKTKQGRLDALLLIYRADLITPREYHERRAKILAEP
ncbi:MAG: hypothetical protein HY735_25110 [Verrucomicrobia bacterium]|nr:hypothetical protein [Verrucomicrobiota bacterium]